MRLITPGVFRFILAFIVVIHHNVDFLLIGHAAVYIFFVLSGYWIAKMYMEKYLKLNKSYRTFVVSRIMRLMPIYYLILLISIITAIIYKGLLTYEGLYTPGFIFSNLFVLGLSNAEFALLLPGWSLDIELQFYFLAPLLLKLIYTNKHTYIHTYIIMFMAMAFSLMVIFFFGEDFVSIITYLPLFLIGMYIYLYNIKSSNRLAYGTLFMAIVLYLMHHILPGLNDIFLHQPDYIFLCVNYGELLNVIIAILVIPYVTVNVRMKNFGKYDKLLLTSE